MITQFDLKGTAAYLTMEDVCAGISKQLSAIASVLQGEVGSAADLGWFFPGRWNHSPLIEEIETLAERIRKEADVFVLVGIGGSNRGAQSVIESLGDNKVEIIYAGDNLSSHAIQGILERIKDRSTYINVIAKDFNTLEPGIAFRVLRHALETKYGSNANEHVIVTGSEGKGQLASLAKDHHYRYLPFPSDMGGRFSVMSAVGLLPIAVAGVDIHRIVQGAMNAERELKSFQVEENPACQYAVARNLLAEKGFLIEDFITFEPSLSFFNRWWVQLFGESEGKNGRAIFPTGNNYSEDLHAIGQYIQEGPRMVMETFLDAHFPHPEIVVQPSLVQDGFDYLDHKPFDTLNSAVYDAAYKAHCQIGVPCFQFHVGEISPEMFGELFYLFMLSCCISSVLIGVNPYGQPGVESYKHEMYRILGKPLQEMVE